MVLLVLKPARNACFADLRFAYLPSVPLFARTESVRAPLAAELFAAGLAGQTDVVSATRLCYIGGRMVAAGD